MSCFLKVFGRVRPSASGNTETALAVVDKNHVKIEAEGKSEKLYELHRIFASSATQEEVFSSVAKRLVEECTEGINGTIFAYGQTGSGKTHTMLGPSDSWSDPHAKGLIPRSIEHLFDQLEKKAEECQKFTFKVNVEFVELYNEEIFDLLSAQSSNKIILRDTGNDIMLAGSKSESVDNSLDLMHIVKKGWQSRRTGATAMNRDSSRSHALLIVKITTDEVNGGLRTTRTSTLNLVDLAGSERQSHSKATGDRLKEATNINSSLTVLGRCIRMLAKPSTAQSFIPYRDSHLTHILKNSLGGNSKTAVIVNMHPDRAFIAESASTLVFAEACTMIKNKVLRNEVMTGDQENSYKRAIQELRRENEEVRAKAYNEFAKRLKDAEDHQHRLVADNASLKAENSELRSKYNMGLVKFLINNDCNKLPESVTKLLHVRGRDDDLVAKMKTLTLEFEASEKRYQELQKERDSNAEKFFNTTINFQTPRGKKRQSSSRNPRRETIYQPSPALNFEDSETELKLQESELRIAQLETENQILKSKFENAIEDMFKAQEARESATVSYEANIATLHEEIEHLNSEIKDLENKVMSGRGTLDKLLTMMKDKENSISNQAKVQAEMEKKFGDDLKNMREYYDTELLYFKNALAVRDKELNDGKSSFESLQHKIDEKDGIIAEMTEKLTTSDVSHSMEVKQLQNLQQKVDEKDLIIAEITDKLKSSHASFSAEIEKLRALAEEKDAFLAKNAIELGQKSKLISKLEKNLERTAAELKKTAHLEDELKNVLSELEESRNNEHLLKATIEGSKKAKQDMYDLYQKEIKNAKVKAQEAVEDKQKSLDVMRKALDLQKQTSEEQRNEASRKFEEKMDSLRKVFDENAKLQQREEEFTKEQRIAKKQLAESHEKEITLLQKRIDILEKQHKEDSAIISNQFAGNRNQKVSYLDKLRQKGKDLEAEVARLLEENTRLKHSKETDGRRVLRSRNPVQND